MPFITNEGEKTLKERITELIEKSTELKFLTGFFYFAGIQELYLALKDLDQGGKLTQNFLKVLVGMNVDENLYGLYEYAKDYKVFKTEIIKNDFFTSLKKALTSKELDQKDTYEQVSFFLKLFKEGKLVIKKTKKPNHSKLYLFKLAEIGSKELFITGSSNLTKAGLKDQEEFNVEIKDYGFKEAEAYFDTLWKDAVELNEKDKLKIIEIMEKETFIREVTPFEAWAYLLKLYLELYTKGDKREVERIKEEFKLAGYTPYEYQVEAVLQALNICKTHRGVLLADVVGLGKTVIACVIAKMLNKRGIVICPPHLMGDENKSYGWKKYLEDFKLHGWEVRSLGKLEETNEFLKTRDDFEIVIIDEAHRFRNEATKRYHYLREICRGKIVILLTATPFNNRPSDIFSMLKLFTNPRDSTLVLDKKLEEKFIKFENLFERLSYIKNYFKSPDQKKRERARKYYNEIFKQREIDLHKVDKKLHNLAREMRSIIAPITIRRNRLDLKYYPDYPKIQLSKVENPQEWFFELTPDQLKFYDEVINIFQDVEEGGKFTGAIYFPIKYEYPYDKKARGGDEKDSFTYESQKNLYDFMRRLLVKRFESSFGAFCDSVKRFLDIHDLALQFIKKTNKFILNREKMEEMIEKLTSSEYEEDDLERFLKEYEESLATDQINSKYHKVYDLNNFKNKEKFIRDLKNDKYIFEYLLHRIKELKLIEETADNTQNEEPIKDPKAQTLITHLREHIKERKVVIFTEYYDTAKYLEKILMREFGEVLLVAIGNLTQSKIEAIYKNFDAQYSEQEDKYKILLTTDKLSEGFNLNRAGLVVSYDIPWNPVRVIQRVGRINRIGKKVYDEIKIANFFPTEKGADITKSREIAENKMFMIHKVLGEDAKIFSPDEEPTPAELYRRLTEFIEDEREENFLNIVKRDYEELKNKYPEVLEAIKNMPLRVKVAKKAPRDELFVFVKRANDLFIAYADFEGEESSKVVNFEDIYEKIKVIDDKKEKVPLSDNFWNLYPNIIENLSSNKGRLSETAHKTINLLKDLMGKESPQLSQYKNFLSNLIEDITHYGTLSKYVLSKIKSWENYLNREDWETLVSEIEILKKEIGEDFIERAKKHFEELKETVIIAIENRNV